MFNYDFWGEKIATVRRRHYEKNEALFIGEECQGYRRGHTKPRIKKGRGSRKRKRR